MNTGEVKRAKPLGLDLSGLDDPALALVLSEEMARNIGEEIAKRVALPKREIVPREVVVQPAMPMMERKRSHTVDKVDYTTSDIYTVIESPGPGIMKECTVRSTSKNYRLYIEADSAEKIHRTFAELQALSSYVESIDAFEVDGTYILRIGEMHWRESFRLVLRPLEEVSFQNIFALWEEYG